MRAPHLRPSAIVLRLAAFAMLLTLAACAGQERAPSTAGGHLFARVLDNISALYIEPGSARKGALSGAAALSRLDQRLTVSESPGPAGGSLTISYDDRNIAYFATPPDADTRAWGDLLETVAATARQASPQIAALPRDAVEQVMFDGMTAALDRFSRYAAPGRAREQRAAREGFGGIGITLDGTSNAFRVAAVISHGPADHAGIRPEDRIVAIDGVATSGWRHQDVINRLRGPVGSAVAVKVLHPTQSQPRELHLRRAALFEPTVSTSLADNIAVLSVNQFNHSTTSRVAEALTEAQRTTGGRLAGIVLDLRSNPGGVLDQAVSLADLFLGDGTIVYVVGRHPASRQHFSATGQAVAPHVPMAVLINGGSASAAEIVAAALQDAGRAVIIGSSSHGKGSVQTVLRLPNNGELILTWAELVAPSGYAIQRHGVVPSLCTADLPDDQHSVAVGLQRASLIGREAAGEARGTPRATLDESAWSGLRGACPARRTRPAVDVALAKRLLGAPALYAAALRVVPAARAGQTAAGARTLP
jgi:carboxyl-terminal processing protease